MIPHMETIGQERFAYTPWGTFSRIFVPQSLGGAMFYGVEPPWKDNQKDVSCIPEGEYTCRKGTYPKHGVQFEVLNVLGRTVVLFGHVGNNEDDVEGCTALGLSLGWVQSKRGTVPKWAVLGSTMACERFHTALKDVTQFRLKVTQYKP